MMAVSTVFLIMLVLVGLAVGVPTLVAYLNGSSKRAELRAAQSREAIAVKALRQIANGDAMPVLTAGDALDRIESTYQKEINS